MQRLLLWTGFSAKTIVNFRLHKPSLHRLRIRASIPRIVQPRLDHGATAYSPRLLRTLVPACVDDAAPEVSRALAGVVVLVVEPESVSVGYKQSRAEVSEESDDGFVLLLCGHGNRCCPS